MIKIESTKQIDGLLFVMLVDHVGKAYEIQFETIEAAQNWVNIVNGK